MRLTSLPMELAWLRPADTCTVDGAALSIAAGPRTDWFVDPAGAEPVLSAPALVGRPPDADYALLAHVGVEMRSAFDAGVLFVHGDDSTWAKLCLERSPDGDPMVVSVVTRGVSDDCNSEALSKAETWLRVARLGSAFAFHASEDGRASRLVRYFGLP